MTPAESSSLQNAPLWQFFKSVTRSFTDRRFSLWFALVGLVVALLITLVWLAGRYEASQYQAELERDTADAVTDIRNGFSRHIVSLQTLQVKSLPSKLWKAEVSLLLTQNRPWRSGGLKNGLVISGQKSTGRRCAGVQLFNSVGLKIFHDPFFLQGGSLTI